MCGAALVEVEWRYDNVSLLSFYGISLSIYYQCVIIAFAQFYDYGKKENNGFPVNKKCLSYVNSTITHVVDVILRNM